MRVNWLVVLVVPTIINRIVLLIDKQFTHGDWSREGHTAFATSTSEVTSLESSYARIFRDDAAEPTETGVGQGPGLHSGCICMFTLASQPGRAELFKENLV